MFLQSMEKELVKGKTTNGAVVYNTSMDSIVDLFAKIGAMREASEAEKVKAFAEAYGADRLLALKVLFYATKSQKHKVSPSIINTFCEILCLSVFVACLASSQTGEF